MSTIGRVARQRARLRLSGVGHVHSPYPWACKVCGCPCCYQISVPAVGPLPCGLCALVRAGVAITRRAFDAATKRNRGERFWHPADRFAYRYATRLRRDVVDPLEERARLRVTTWGREMRDVPADLHPLRAETYRGKELRARLRRVA